MSNQIVIRTVVEEDLTAVFRLEQEAFCINAYPRFFFRQAFDVFGDLFRVAENEDRRIVGYILGTLQYESTEGWILSMTVKREHRRCGIAKLLMNSVLKILSNKGVKRVLLTVEPDNKVAIKAYRTFNFQEINTVSDYFGPGSTRILMGRDL